jgi:DNA-binding transcriptional regulator YdaS (Cro superfamily)
MNEGVKLAVTAAGSRSALARSLRITRGAISQWSQVPAERVIAVEKATGIPRHMLRPDLHPPLRKRKRPANRGALCA